MPSTAIDIAPVQPDGSIKWGTKEDPEDKEWAFLAGFFMCCLIMCGVVPRWGGDWDSDLDLDDNHFNDYVHFEAKAFANNLQPKKGG
jgi:hypothetical protein